MTVEYRVCWNASSNITFEGASDWQEWYGDEDTSPDNALGDAIGQPNLPEGLEIALEASGFDWWVESREAQEDAV